MNLEQRLYENSLTNGVKLCISLVVGFALPPLTISFIGIEGYGIWALILAISQLVYIVDLGLQPALSKYVAEFRVDEEYGEISKVIAASLMIYIAGSLLLLALLLVGWGWIIPIMFNADPQELGSLGILLLLMILITLVNLVSGVFAAILNGLQRMDVSNYISTAGLLISAIATFALLALGLKLWALVAASALSTIFVTGVSYIYINRLAPKLSLGFLRGIQLNGESLRNLLTLSSSDATNRFVGTLLGSGIRFLLSTYAGLSAVAYYELASRFVAQLSMFALIMFTPLVAAVSELNALRAVDRIRTVTTHSLRYLNILALPPFVFSVLLASPLVKVWLGEGYEIVALGIQILALGTYVSVLNGAAYHSLIGMGRPLLGVHFAIINLVLNLTLTVILTMKFKFLGTVIGQSLALSLASIYFMIQSYSVMGIAFSRIRETLVRPAVIIFVISPILWAISWIAFAMGVSEQILIWVTIYGIFAVSFYSLLWRYRIIGRQDLELIRLAYNFAVGQVRK